MTHERTLTAEGVAGSIALCFGYFLMVITTEISKGILLAADAGTWDRTSIEYTTLLLVSIIPMILAFILLLFGLYLTWVFCETWLFRLRNWYSQRRRDTL
jgi:ABC-type dipeptide/oligopeptide/nickel transport system permease component